MTVNERQPALLLFGGTGAIGREIGNRFCTAGWRVVVVTRGEVAKPGHVRWDPLDTSDAKGLDAICRDGPFEAVCWAQGTNGNDNVYDVDLDEHMQMYRSNCVYIVASLNSLLRLGLLARPARLCVISSIWQNISRQSKLSYGMSKAALQGLVLSAANDLGRDGHLINAVLPGALDTPMTHANLTSSQVEALIGGTQFKRLATLGDVASTVYFLCSEANTGVTGQFIKVDLGYSDVRIV